MTYSVVCLCKGRLEVYEHNLMVFVFTVFLHSFQGLFAYRLKICSVLLVRQSVKSLFLNPNLGFFTKIHQEVAYNLPG
jgi:hypothetical protein